MCHLAPSSGFDGVTHEIPEFGVGVPGRFARMPDFHHRAGVADHLAHNPLAAFAELPARHDGVAGFIYEAAAGEGICGCSQFETCGDKGSPKGWLPVPQPRRR